MKGSLVALTILYTSCAWITYGSQLITNGGFETGNFTGWTTAAQTGSAGSFSVASGTTAPLSGMPTVGPASGAFYALSDSSGPSALALIQSFTVSGPASSVVLSYSLFANSYGGVFEGDGLDWTFSGANQFARVDILKAGAGAFDTGSGVLANLFLGADSGSNPHAYTTHTSDITSIVGAGGTFQLRFAEVNNVNFFNLGVDNVSIVTAVGAVPEPSSILLGGIGMTVLALLRSVRRPIR